MFNKNSLTIKCLAQILSLIAFLGGQAPVAVAQTPVSGGIFSNTTWTLANSPYLMTGNVVVFPGVTLTIEPGVEVRVASSSTPAAGYYLETRGTVNMIGLPGLPVRFRSDTALNTVAAWDGFRINDPQGGTLNFNYVDLSNANILFNYYGNTPANLLVEGSTFNYNYYALNVGLSLEARGCNFKGNYSAITGWSQFKLTNCVFDSNGAAVSIYPSSLEIDSCIFTRNAGGLVLSAIPINQMSIRRSIFEYNNLAISNPGNGTIDSCVFNSNQEGITGAVQAFVINSAFRDNQSALRLGFGSVVRDCNISDNQTGVILGPFSFGQPMPLVENNRICNNALYNVDNQTDLNLFLATNCFCLSDSVQVEAKLYDGYDDISKGLISYAIFDTSCLTVLRVINKFTTSGFDLTNNTREDYWTCSSLPQGGLRVTWGRVRSVDIQLSSLFGQVVYRNLSEGDQHEIDPTLLTQGWYICSWRDRVSGERGRMKVWIQ